MNYSIKLLLGHIFVLANIFTVASQNEVNVLQVEQLTTKDGLPHNAVTCIVEDKNGFLWLSSFYSICRYDGYAFHTYNPEQGDSNSLISNSIYNLVADLDTNIWIEFFSSDKYCRYSYSNDNFDRIDSLKANPSVAMSRSREPVRSVKEGSDILWELSDGSIFRHNLANGDTEEYSLDFAGLPVLYKKQVASMCLDRFGILWIGTGNQGLFKINTRPKPFTTRYKDGEICQRLINGRIRAICEDKSTLWLGTEFSGVYKIDKRTSAVVHMTKNANDPQHSIAKDHIRALLLDSYGELWIGTKGGLTRYNPKTDSYHQFTRHTNPKIPDPWVFSLMEDHEGNVWIGTYKGIVRYDRNADTYLTIRPERYLKSNKISCLMEDRDYNLWVSTHTGGVTCLKPTNEIGVFDAVHFVHDPKGSIGLSSNRVFCVLQDEDGFIWASTDFGVNRIDLENGECRRFSVTEGLQDNMVVGMLNDHNGNLWLSHKKGVSKLELSSFRITNYSEHDGLLSNDCSEDAYFRNPETGEMFIGNAVGFNSFLPSRVVDNNLSPQLRFTSLQVLNKEVRVSEEVLGHMILKKPIWLTDSIMLTHDHVSFSLRFAGLQFINPKTIKYKYRLKGFDKDWVLVNADARYAAYSNLPAGTYTFMVKASGGNGRWSDDGVSLHISILPPWWQTWWAKVLYLIVFAVLFLLVYWYVVARERLKHELKYEKLKGMNMQELDRMKMQFFTNISHELRTPLTLLIDPLRKLSKGVPLHRELDYYYQLMFRNAQYLLKLVNQLLDFRKVEDGQLALSNSQADSVAFVKQVCEVFELDAGGRNIQFDVRANPKSLWVEFDSDKLEKILFNLLSNAFKFTPDGGRVGVDLELVEFESKDHVRLQVSDTGLGIASSELEKIFEPFYQVPAKANQYVTGTGIGLAHTRELVLLMGGWIHAESEQGAGARLVVMLPVKVVDEPVSSVSDIDPVSPVVENASAANLVVEGLDTEKLTVLVVEDNVEVLRYIEDELGVEYNVIKATDGKLGLERVFEYLPDVVVSDVMMPVMDGFELCRSIKNSNEICHIPVVLLTAKQTDEAMLDGYGVGADAYLKKPFNSEVLLVRVKTLIEGRKRLQIQFATLPYNEIDKVTGNKLDRSFVKQATELIEKHIEEPDFRINVLADNLKVTREQLSHKIKTLTGNTVNEFVVSVKMKKAADLLLLDDTSISDVAFRLGYSVPSNFTRTFKKHYGQSPTKYIQCKKHV